MASPSATCLVTSRRARLPAKPAPAPVPVAPAPPPPPPPDTCGRIVLRGVNFEFDKANIDAASAGVLDVAAEQLTTARA